MASICGVSTTALTSVEDVDELALGTDPFDVDTDDDGLPDGEEADLGTDPLAWDTDGGGGSDDGRACVLWSVRGCVCRVRARVGWLWMCLRSPCSG